MALARQRGFTLVETLIAMTLACAVLLPASMWLYHSRSSRAALARFRATQMLEMELDRAWLLRLDRDFSREIPAPGYIRLRIHPLRDGRETRLIGTAEDRQGHILASLQAGYFGEDP
jgi:prepilin-type N-terminal cleavage/methylation domain-containing protein